MWWRVLMRPGLPHSRAGDSGAGRGRRAGEREAHTGASPRVKCCRSIDSGGGPMPQGRGAAALSTSCKRRQEGADAAGGSKGARERGRQSGKGCCVSARDGNQPGLLRLGCVAGNRQDAQQGLVTRLAMLWQQRTLQRGIGRRASWGHPRRTVAKAAAPLEQCVRFVPRQAASAPALLRPCCGLLKWEGGRGACSMLQAGA